MFAEGEVSFDTVEVTLTYTYVCVLSNSFLDCVIVEVSGMATFTTVKALRSNSFLESIPLSSLTVLG